MSKSKIARVAGFTVAAGATATLVGFAATGTGAYFSDAKSGTANISTGSVEVHTDNISGLDFTNLLPGDYKTQQIHYASNGTGPEDIYLAFDQAGDAPLNALNNASATDPLGRYGHLKVTGNAGNFQSNNLSTNTAAGTPGKTVAGDCNIDPNTGLGGSDALATRDSTTPSDGYYNDGVGEGTGHATSTIPFCPAPQYILLAKGLQPSDGTQTASIEFGYTQIMDDNSHQNGLSGETKAVPFRIVAEQAGVSPYDTNTTNGHGH